MIGTGQAPTNPIVHVPVDFVGSINGLVIISSAILAIIQYVDRDNVRILDEYKTQIKSLDFPSLDDVKGHASRDACKNLKKKQDLLSADYLPSSSYLLKGLLFLLPTYAFLHVGKDICPFCERWLPNALIITSSVLFILSIAMLIWIRAVSKKKKIFLGEAKTFLQMAKAFLDGWNAGKLQKAAANAHNNEES